MRNFKNQATTTAQPSVIWDIWRDVSNWNQWDTELEYSRLSGDFVMGANGVLKAKNSPESRFTITELTPGKSFTFTVQMPLASMDVAHYFAGQGQTTFVHDVTFKGPMGWLFGLLLSGGYSKALPGVLDKIKGLAEAKSK